MSLLSVTKSEGENNNFVCDLCDNFLGTKGPMVNHRIQVHTVQNKDMYCDFCDEIFKSKTELCSHMNSVNSEHFVVSKVDKVDEKTPTPIKVEEEAIEITEV